MPYHCRYFPLTAAIQVYQYVFLLLQQLTKIILRTLNALSLQILSTDGCYSSLSICIPETYNSTCYNNSQKSYYVL